MNSLVLTVRLKIEDESFAQEYTLPEMEWERIAPPKRPIIDPLDLYDVNRANEERKRWIDMISANIAHTITAAILTKYTKDVR